MKRLDEGKVSLVEFLGSIKFSRDHGASTRTEAFDEQFARLEQRTRRGHRSEDAQLVRSAN